MLNAFLLLKIFLNKYCELFHESVCVFNSWAWQRLTGCRVLIDASPQSEGLVRAATGNSNTETTLRLHAWNPYLIDKTRCWKLRNWVEETSKRGDGRSEPVVLQK